jgi:hypothetical protein
MSNLSPCTIFPCRLNLNRNPNLPKEPPGCKLLQHLSNLPQLTLAIGCKSGVLAIHLFNAGLEFNQTHQLWLTRGSQ